MAADGLAYHVEALGDELTRTIDPREQELSPKNQDLKTPAPVALLRSEIVAQSAFDRRTD